MCAFYLYVSRETLVFEVEYAKKIYEWSIKRSEKSLQKDEVPIGAIIVKDNGIISKAHNLVETKKDATMHAEIIAIKKASKK